MAINMLLETSNVADLKKSAVPEPSAKFDDNICSSIQYTDVTVKLIAPHVIPLLFIFLTTILQATIDS